MGVIELCVRLRYLHDKGGKAMIWVEGGGWDAYIAYFDRLYTGTFAVKKK